MNVFILYLKKCALQLGLTNVAATSGFAGWRGSRRVFGFSRAEGPEEVKTEFGQPQLLKQVRQC